MTWLPRGWLCNTHLLKDGSDVSERWPALAVLRCADLFSRLVCIAIITKAVHLWEPLSSLSALVLSKLESVWVNILLVFNWNAALE